MCIEAGEAAVKIAGGGAAVLAQRLVGERLPADVLLRDGGRSHAGRQPFVDTLTKVGRAASRDETRPILTGVLVTMSGDVLKMVATDSYRLGVKETTLEGAWAPTYRRSCRSRRSTRWRASRRPWATASSTVVIGENQALFRLSDAAGDVLVASRLIDGQFPNYKQLLPETFDHDLALGKDLFAGAARRVSLLAQKNAPLRLAFTEGKLTIRAVTQDVGQAEETMDAPFEGEPVRDRLQPAFLIEGIEAVDDDEVTLKFTNPLRPGLVRGADGSFVYLIMPIRLSG